MKVYVVTVDTYAEGSEVKAVCNSLILAKKIKNNVQEELEELGMDFSGSVLVNIREYPLITSEGEIEMLKGKIDPGRKIEANSPSRKFSYNEDYSKITTMLDRIAGSLQEKGLLKESKSIDVVSNTIEAGWLDNFNLFLNKILKKIGVQRLPTPLDAAKALSGVPLQTLDKIGDALFGPGGGPPSAPPLAITSSVITSPPFLSDPEMSESIPSEIERLDTSEKRLIPAYLRVIKELSKQKPGSIPEPEQIKDEIDRLIAETSVPS